MTYKAHFTLLTNFSKFSSFLPLLILFQFEVPFSHFLDTLTICFSKKLMTVLSDYMLALLTFSSMIGFSSSYNYIPITLIEETLLDH